MNACAPVFPGLDPKWASSSNQPLDISSALSNCHLFRSWANSRAAMIERCDVSSVLSHSPRCGSKPRVQNRSEGSQSSLCQRSEEHTSELQSRPHLVCRLL